MENFIFCTMKIPEFWHNKANYVFFRLSLLTMGISRLKLLPVFGWAPKFLGAQIHKWVEQRFHESREKTFEEYLVGFTMS